MNKIDKKLFVQIFRSSQAKLLKFLPSILKILGYTDIHHNNEYIYAIGNTDIMLVAHLDHVHLKEPRKLIWNKKGNSVTCPSGLGADDRAGIFSILKILVLTGKRPFILFSTDEEIGGIGTRLFLKDYPIAPDGLKYIIELDRKGINDAVFYDCNNPKFTNFIESYGYKKDYGSFSDISFICPLWRIAGVNLSIGYYKAHTKQEYLVINDMYGTINRVNKLLEYDSEPFEYMEDNKTYSKYTKFLDDDYCYYCGTDDRDLKKDNQALTTLEDGDIVCPTCLQSEFFYCNSCYEYKHISEKSLQLDNICYDCADFIFNDKYKIN